MSVYRDRGYWRLRWWNDEAEEGNTDEYFGKDKIQALSRAAVICRLKIRKWEKREKEYLDELEKLMERGAGER